MTAKKQSIILVSLITALVAYQWLFSVSIGWALFPFLIGAGIVSIKSVPFFLQIWVDVFRAFGVKAIIHHYHSHVLNFITFLLVYSVASLLLNQSTHIISDPFDHLQKQIFRNSSFMFIGFFSNLIAHRLIPIIKPRGSKLSYLMFALAVFSSAMGVIYVMLNVLTYFGVNISQ